VARVGALAGRDIDALFNALRPRILALGNGGAGGIIGPQGPAGPKGVVWRGAWAADTDYSTGDIVTDATDPGTSPLTFFCLTDHTSLTATRPTVGGDANWHEINSGYLLTDGSRPFVLSPGHTPAEGCLSWDTADGIDRLVMDVAGTGGLVQTPVGGVYIRASNQSGNLIAASVPVYIFSTDEGLNQLMLDKIPDTLQIETGMALGITMQSIADTAEGWVCCHGYAGGLDMSGYAAGWQLFVQGSGNLSDTPPLKGCASRIRMGIVIAATNPGSMWVQVEHRPDLDELANVSIGDFALAKQSYDVPMWLEDPTEVGCPAWRDYPASRFPSVTVTENYVIVDKDVVVLVDASAAEVSVELPQATVVNAGRLLRVKLITGPYHAVVTTAAAELIDGDATVTLVAEGESLDLQMDEIGDWRVM